MSPTVAASVSRAFPRIEIAGRPQPPQPLPLCPYRFPDPESVDAEGAATMGGDFEPATIVKAYRRGFFPWPHNDFEYLWFSPDPRAIIPVGQLHISRSLARLLRHLPFRLSLDTAFDEVVAACARRPEGTWITPNYQAGYSRLRRLGWAHSFEARDSAGVLAGGLYGVRIGRMFAAESMFHRVTDASKVAMAAMMQWVEAEGIELVDVQVLTPHTARMGAVEIPRREFLARLADAVRGAPTRLPAADAADTVGTLPGTTA